MIRRIAWIIIWMGCITFVFSQDYERKWGIGFGLGAKDYESLPIDGSLNVDIFQPAIYTHIGRYLAPSWELHLAGMIPFPDYLYTNPAEPTYQGSLHLYYRLNNGYLLKKESRFAPYLSAGGQVGFRNFEDQDYVLSIPVGLGLRLQPAKFISLQFGGNYHLAAVANKSVQLVSFQTGLSFHLGNSQKASATDVDGDGIKNTKDSCPDVAGLKRFQGCPDTDSDGVPDNTDKCVSLAGVPEYDGCPEGDEDRDGFVAPVDECPDEAGNINRCPDSDNDGIPNHIDDCPREAGSPQSLGCPDADKDGIPDKEDQCPDEPGMAEYQGCMQANGSTHEKLQELAIQVKFVPKTAILATGSFEALDQLAEMMADEEEINVRISVFTDAQGNPAKLIELALERAETCKSYLIQQGISASDIITEGYGPYFPIQDNFTQSGSEQNNRVKFQFITP